MQKRAIQNLEQPGVLEAIQTQHSQARKQCCIHFVGRILGGGSDQGECAVFHKGQECVLLAFVQSVDLIEKQNRFPSELTIPTGFFRRFLDFLHSGGHC